MAAGQRRRNAGRRGTGGAGAGGAAALVVNQARTQLYATHHGGAGGVPGPTQRRCHSTSEDWDRRGGTGGGPGPTDIEESAGGVMSRPRCGRNSDSDGRDLRFSGLVQHAGQHHSTAPMEQGEKCRPYAVGLGGRRRLTADRAEPEHEPRCIVRGPNFRYSTGYTPVSYSIAPVRVLPI